MNEKEKQAASYVADMLSRSDEYDVSITDLSNAISNLKDLDLNSQTRAMLQAMESLNLAKTVCGNCDQDKFYNEEEKVYYCPVCDP